MRIMHRRICYAAALVVLSALASAQTSSTEISGLVRDSSGASVTGAEVTLTRVATGESRHATTNSEGVYALPIIEPGEYTLPCGIVGIQDDNRLEDQRSLPAAGARGCDARNRRADTAR